MKIRRAAAILFTSFVSRPNISLAVPNNWKDAAEYLVKKKILERSGVEYVFNG